MRNQLIISEISKTIHSKDINAEVFLYGSRARGSNRKNSDWDILILVEDDIITNDIDDKFRDEIYNIELEYGQIISTIIYQKKYWETKLLFSPLSNNVLKEGVKI